jgi:hypothetical protein
MVKLEEVLTPKAVMFIQLLRLIGFLFITCHWLACTLGYIGQGPQGRRLEASWQHVSEWGDTQYIRDAPGWLERIDELRDAPIGEQYLCSYHWIIAILTGSHGQINAANASERLYEIFVMYIALFLSSVLMAKVIEVLQHMAKELSAFREKMRFIMLFMSTNKVPGTFQTKVRKYLEFAFRNRTETGADLNVLETLSPGLRSELQGHLMRPSLMAHVFFERLPFRVQDALCGVLEILIFATGDQVYAEGTVPVGLYVVKSGGLVARPSEKSHFPGSYVGDVGFFLPDRLRVQSLFASDNSEVVALPSSGVLDIAGVLGSVQREYDIISDKIRAAVEAGTLAEVDTTPVTFFDDVQQKKTLKFQARPFLSRLATQHTRKTEPQHTSAIAVVPAED